MTKPLIETAKRPSKSDEKRDRILKAALKIAIAKGIQEVTLTEVARTAKLSKSHVAYYFPKNSQILEALFLACAQQGQEETLKLVSLAATPQAQLDAMAMGAVKWALKYPDFARFFILIYHHATVNSAIAKQHSGILEIGRGRIEMILKTMDAQGAHPRVSAALRSKLIQQLLIGTLIRAVSLNELELLEADMTHSLTGMRALAELKT